LYSSTQANSPHLLPFIIFHTLEGNPTGKLAITQQYFEMLEIILTKKRNFWWFITCVPDLIEKCNKSNNKLKKCITARILLQALCAAEIMVLY